MHDDLLAEMQNNSFNESKEQKERWWKELCSVRDEDSGPTDVFKNKTSSQFEARKVAPGAYERMVMKKRQQAN